MKNIIAFLLCLFFTSNYLLSNNKENSFIENIDKGTNYCNKFFQEKMNSLKTEDTKFENFFICKFSKKRKRFYIYMLSEERDQKKSLKINCMDILNDSPWISDHMNPKFDYQNKKYLEGFFNTQEKNKIQFKEKLDNIVRYKIFLNDTKKFKSYSCTWSPSKGMTPYIKLEKFKEFENI
tara:strand:+ start:241 stop:777 length:537 start_codon:yes stop_codon:yes gene_type:complete